MGKLTISMAIFNSYVSLPEGISVDWLVHWVGLGETCKKHVQEPMVSPSNVGLSCNFSLQRNSRINTGG